MALLTQRVHVNDDVLFQELQGDSVLLNLKSGVYFGLNVVGTRIWKLLCEHDILVDVLKAMLAEYDVTEDLCETDLLTLVTTLEKHGLVTLS